MEKLKKNLLLLIFALGVLPSALNAQNLDSLYNFFTRTLGGEKNLNSIQTESEIIKCATPLIVQIQENYDKFSKAQQAKISSILSRPTTQTSIVSPSGFFRIHYDTTGDDAIGYDVNLLAEAADSAYNFEVNILGYPVPPSDDGEGGDDSYDIYVINDGGSYGGTYPINGSSYTASYIEMDNDFENYYTEGIDAARVTIAHEFHHAIQFGHYIVRSADRYFYEILSTSMEEFVYDDVNDYYGYMSGYFNHPERAFYNTYGSGYDLAIWNIFLQKKYGYDVIKHSLENIVQYDAIEAIAAAVTEEGSSLQAELNDFGKWTYFTGSRAIEGEYFEEGANYPTIKPLITCDSANWSKTINTNPVSNNFILVSDDETSGFPDTLMFIVTNGDYLKTSMTGMNFSLYNYSISNPDYNIGSLYYVKLDSDEKDSFSLTSIFNNKVVSDTTTIERDEIDYAFPQPFNYSKYDDMKFPVAKDQSGKAALNIYTVSMELVYSGEKSIIAGKKVYVAWAPQKSNGKKLPTGVYIYVTKAGDTIKKGKFVIIND